MIGNWVSGNLCSKVRLAFTMIIMLSHNSVSNLENGSVWDMLKEVQPHEK